MMTCNNKTSTATWIEKGEHIVDLESKIQTFMSKASKEDLTILSNIVDGLLEKQADQHQTYLSAITHVTHDQRNEDEFELQAPITPLLYNPLKMVHGGITATLLDSAMGLRAVQSLPNHLAAVTSQLNIHYIRPGFGSRLRCVARTVHTGRQLVVVEGETYDDKNRLVAKATGTFYVIPRKPHEEARM